MKRCYFGKKAYRQMKRAVKETHPDYILYKPKGYNYYADNVHLIVTEHPNFNGLIAFWTQSSIEGAGNNHIVISKSKDNGKSWSKPKYIVGSTVKNVKKASESQASWAFPIINDTGRIYLFYFRETEFIDNGRQITGALCCIYSDDIGNTWSAPVDIKMRHTPYDYTDNISQNNCVYQKPIRVNDKWIVGYTKWSSFKIKQPNDIWYERDSHCYFMSFDNLNSNPEVKDIKITYLPDDENGISIPYKNISVAQEPSLILLPDGRLYTAMRNLSGYIYYSVSCDLGHTWETPKPLVFENGEKFVHPLSPVPAYDLGDGRYIQFYHGEFEDIGMSRNPLKYATARFDKNSPQPLVFYKSDDFMKLTENSPSFGKIPRISMYSSLTTKNGEIVVWYPDRKFFLLGKKIK